jgi:predicted molibdopterin-dependent oxidoreductase YjgC
VKATAARGIVLRLDGRPVTVPPGTTVAAALWNAGVDALRASVAGEPRGPLCGMGICFECRVTIDGVAHRRACMVTCAPGMEVETGAAAAAAGSRGMAAAPGEQGEPGGIRRGLTAPGGERGGA